MYMRFEVEQGFKASLEITFKKIMTPSLFLFVLFTQIIDNKVQDVFLNYERRAEPLVQFQRQVQDLPKMVEQVQNITVAISK